MCFKNLVCGEPRPLVWVGSIPEILQLLMVGHCAKCRSSSYNSWSVENQAMKKFVVLGSGDTPIV